MNISFQELSLIWLEYKSYTIKKTSLMQYKRIQAVDKVKKSTAFRCAGHGTNSVGDKPTTGIYRQV